MNRILAFLLITILAIFLGSQITEGCLLVPYWKSLSTLKFYEYYSKFGKTIGSFYTILTVISALIPISISIYCLRKKSLALKYSLFSSFLILVCIAFFYIYFKDTNQQFYNAVLNPSQLKSELEIWEYWHWSRVVLELLSLIFLVLAINILTNKRILNP